MALAMTAYCLAALVVPGSVSRTDEWPALLSPTADTIEPDIAMLQLRANVVLARLVEAGQSVD